MLESTVKTKLRALIKSLNEKYSSPICYLYHYPNNGRGVKGFPDYILYAKHSKNALIECKAPGKKLSPGQEEFKKIHDELGSNYFVYSGQQNEWEGILSFILGI
jgi:hypothetical protein